jgi:putative aldouronate transport system permease protein
MRIKDSFGDKVVNFLCYTIVILVSIACLYPLWLVLIYSVSDPNAVNAGKVWLWPVGVNWDAYKEVFARDDLMKGYWNTITQTLFGTTVNMVLTIPAAYALSKRNLKGRNFIMGLIVFTMYFSGGLIPNFINLMKLKLLNTWWVFGLVGAVSSYNLIVARTFFASGIPHELEEAAEIDGCSVAGTFMKIVLPLSKAMLGVIMLYYLVGHWNNFATALYYTPRSTDYWPLQMVIRNLLQTLNQLIDTGDEEALIYYSKIYDMIKYAVVVVAAVPVLVIYPFLQKYFNKGVMLGSVKG